MKSKIPDELIGHLTQWMIAEHARIHGLKRVPKNQKDAIHDRACKLVEMGKRNKSLRIFNKNGVPIAMITRAPSRMPRVKNQQSLFFMYDDKQSKFVKPWIHRNLHILAKNAPRFTAIGFNAEEDGYYRSCLTKAGFHTRYEILLGNTRLALSNLIKEKNPPANLDHLGLDLRPISTRSQVAESIKLQKTVALKSRSHGYFSHTDTQLKKDKKEYEQIISKKNGLILGAYRGKKLLGLMMAGIYEDDSSPKRTGGFSFFLHPSIQGLGITKTGYLLLLKYLLQNKVQKFYGGTSQPAIQTLGRIMKREIQFIIYVKMN